jgi:hypothetical protein
VPATDGRQRRALDGIVVNEPMKSRIIPGSYRVHQPADTGPGSRPPPAQASLPWPAPGCAT